MSGGGPGGEGGGEGAGRGSGARLGRGARRGSGAGRGAGVRVGVVASRPRAVSVPIAQSSPLERVKLRTTWWTCHRHAGYARIRSLAGPGVGAAAEGSRLERRLSRRQVLAAAGGVGVLAAIGADESIPWPQREPASLAGATGQSSGYAPDGTAGATAALPLHDVELLDSTFSENMARNTAYLVFLDHERMLRPFRLNYGQTTDALPC